MQDETKKLNDFSVMLFVIFGGLMMGQLLFAGVTFFVLKPAVVANQDQLFLYLTIGMIGAGIAAGFFFWNKLKTDLQTTENLDDKLSKYRTATIIRMALLEGPNLFGIVAYLQTGNQIILGIAAAGMVIFAAYVPLKNKVMKDLGYSNSI